MLRARRRIPRFIATVTVVAILTVLLLRATTTGTAAGSGSGSEHLVDPLITYTQLRDHAAALASSTPHASLPIADPPLVERVTRSLVIPPGRPPGRNFIDMMWTVKLGVPRSRVEQRSIGWPGPWIDIRRYYNYTDPFFRTGLRPSVTDPALTPLTPSRFGPPFYDTRRVPSYPRFQWFEDLVRYQLPPEAASGCPVISDIWFVHIVATAGILIAAWYIASAFAGARRAILRSPASRRRLIPLAFTLLVVSAITTRVGGTSDARFEPMTYFNSGGNLGLGPGSACLSFDVEQLSALHGPEGDRILAAAILDQIPPCQDEPKDDAVLAVGWRPAYRAAQRSSVQLGFGPALPFVWANRATFEPNSAAVDAGPFLYKRGLSISTSFAGRGVVFRYSSGRPDLPTYTLAFDLARTAALITVVWFLWFLSRSIIILTQRAQLRRRASRNLCLQCRYPRPASP